MVHNQHHCQSLLLLGIGHWALPSRLFKTRPAFHGLHMGVNLSKKTQWHKYLGASITFLNFFSFCILYIYHLNSPNGIVHRIQIRNPESTNTIVQVRILADVFNVLRLVIMMIMKIMKMMRVKGMIMIKINQDASD